MSTSPVTPVRPPHRLRCEYRENPLGIDDPQPRLTWQLDDPRQDARQTAYQIRAASTIDLLALDEPDLWDSGKVAAPAGGQIPYGGPVLKSRQSVHWKVRIWDGDDHGSPWSAPQYWEMGLLRGRGWSAQWIGLPDEDPAQVLRPCPHLRREWTQRAPAVKARLYVTALGLHEVRLNGRRITDANLLPGWTDYRQRIPYHVFDVTTLLDPEQNAVGVKLANGWYAGHLAWNKQVYGAVPRLLFQLEMTLADGTHQTVVSDAHWKAATGPLVLSDLLMGETHDARLEMPGWDAPGFDDQAWRPVLHEARGAAPLQAHAGPPVRPLAERAAETVTTPAPDTYIFDFGQNLTGHVRLKVPAGLPPGHTLTLRHAEVLNPDGTLYTTNLRGAAATDRYVARGGEAGVWEPVFTLHGFRYAEITGLPAAPAPDVATAIVQHSDTPFIGAFTCSHELLNRLQQNIQWGQRGNFIEVPTDCPQRDERLGWTGDAQIFCRTAGFNADVGAFFTQWMINVTDAQREGGLYTNVAPDVAMQSAVPSPGWSDAGLIVPWTMYLTYGDRRILERHYESYRRYLDALVRQSPEFIGPDWGFGDWLQADTFTPLDLISTAYFAHSADLMRQIAEVLGRGRDARRYATLGKRVRKAFQRRFVTPDGRMVGDTQAAYVLALHFDLLPEALRPAAVANLAHQILEGRSSRWPYPKRDGHLSTGFLAVDKICDVLTRGGRLDLAYRLLLNETYPSWLFPVKNGATTIWERWDGWTPDRGFADPNMNSFNHYAYGAIGDWLYRTVAGLDLAPDGAGGTHWLMRPQPLFATADRPAPLTAADAATESPLGRARSAWRIEGERFEYTIEVPPGARATVVLPVGTESTVTVNGAPLASAPGLRDAGVRHGHLRGAVGAGRHIFHAPLPPMA